MNLTPEILEKSINFISETPEYKRLSPRYKGLVSKYPDLRESKEFQAVYSKVRDKLIPQISNTCFYCEPGFEGAVRSHYKICVNEFKKVGR
jgi:hypothetical protein